MRRSHDVTTVVQRTTGAEVYAAYAKEWLEREQQLATALEARGGAVITTAGAFVTLLFALAGLAGQDARLLRAAAGRPGLLVACLLFSMAALAAIGIVMPQRQSDLDPDALLDDLRACWDDPADVAVSRITADRISTLQGLHRANTRRGLLLLVATASVAGGVVALAAAVVLSLPA
jgi:hypothetical protein